MNSQEATVSMIATTLSVMSKQLLAVEAPARDAARHAHLSLGQSKANAERLVAIAQTATDTLDVGVTAAGAEVQVVVICEVQATGPTTTEPTTTEPTACDAVQFQVPVPVEAATVQPSRPKRIKKRKAKGKRAKKLKSTEVVSLSSDEALELYADSTLE